MEQKLQKLINKGKVDNLEEYDYFTSNADEIDENGMYVDIRVFFYGGFAEISKNIIPQDIRLYYEPA